ncbi:MAG: prolyl oligopeptidase family serine peptidase [Candidatus Moranbacteria bacterium]|jgi:dipeptidyl aminopeptidase/acylaminoacyl peptidase|nr:prolyl oligopeptidase family serine peptidase [Candidatus Moranbacteria bacterium]
MALTDHHPLRARFAKDIVAEILLPKRQTGKAALLASGIPSAPVKKELLHFLADRGYVVIFPRYRGTWESTGYFLERSPAQDFRDILDELALKKKFRDILSGERIAVRVDTVHLFGSSFGGPAVLLNSQHPLVKKVIAIAPVLDWQIEGEDEPFGEFVRYTCEGFGDAYRTKKKSDWQKLVETDFYNPSAHTKMISGKKVFILHAKDDTNVPYNPVMPFVEATGATFYIKPKGGHHIRMTHGFLWKKIEAFLKKV